MDREEREVEEIRNEIINQIVSSSEYRKMAADYKYLLMNGKLAKATNQLQKMHDYQKREYDKLVKVYTSKVRTIDGITASMKPEDKKTFDALTNGLIMISDVLQLMVGNIQSLYNKYNNESRISSFDELTALSEAARKKVSAFDCAYGSDRRAIVFGDMCDDLYELIYNKAKSFCNKAERIQSTNK